MQLVFQMLKTPTQLTTYTNRSTKNKERKKQQCNNNKQNIYTKRKKFQAIIFLNVLFLNVRN